jgi:hypothetical protein
MAFPRENSYIYASDSGLKEQIVLICEDLTQFSTIPLEK